jgi:hypothetical protein
MEEGTAVQLRRWMTVNRRVTKKATRKRMTDVR